MFNDRIRMQTNFIGHNCTHSRNTTRFVHKNSSKLANQQTWNYQTKNHSLLIGAKGLKLRGQIEKNMIDVSLGTCFFSSFLEEGSIPVNKMAHLLYLWSHHEMFKKLNCPKSSQIKWQQPQDLTQPNTKTVHSKLGTYFEKNKQQHCHK